MDRSEKSIIIIVLVVVSSCLIFAALCGGIFFLINKMVPQSTPLPFEPSLTIVPSVPLVVPTRTPTQQVDISVLDDAARNLLLLENTIIPTSDLTHLAEKFEGKTNIPTHLTTPPVNYKIGDSLEFFKLNVDNNENVKTRATLRYATGNVYFWVEEGIAIDLNDLKTVMDQFSNQIYPTDQEFFGKEWIPGVDNDPHLFILWARGLGSHLAGYTLTTDSVLPLAHPFSNAKEIFMINADVQTLTDPYTLSVMAHELQHLIHGYHDPNEELWMNEGFSELAVLLNGYDPGGFDTVFSYDPDLQLNDWAADPNLADPHYGASFLYTTYLLDRFGEETTRAVVASPLNGFESIDNVFSENNLIDPITHNQVTADSFFADWVVANYLQDTSISDGRYSYHVYQSAPLFSPTLKVNDCANQSVNSTVHQFGTDYISLECSGKIDLEFSGNPTIGVLPVPINGSKYFMWSSRADTSDMTMTHDFDFSSESGPITLSFDTWYDLEKDYDYVYLLASVDNGTWQIIDTPTCSTTNISGNNYGCGINGTSDGWKAESVDLSQYAGKKVSLRFEYVTDGAISNEGFLVDNLTIPEIGYSTDFEIDDGGWQTEGFARIMNSLPQTFIVSVINLASKEPVTNYFVKSGEKLALPLEMNAGEPVTISISGSTRFTRQLADYSLLITQ
jgi:immune inhibitor A